MISIIIPAYNEEKNIPRIGKELVPVMKKIREKYEIVIVDDGSIDNTVKEIKKLQKRYKNIKLLRHSINKGIGSAVRTAIPKISGGVTIILDSDFTFHPREIPKLLNAYEKYDADCIIGSHFTKGGKTKNVPMFRIVLSKSVTTMYSLALGRKISSITSIFRLYKTKYLKDLELNSKDFKISAEILYKLLEKNRKIIEVPVTLSKRIYGKSKIKIKNEIKGNILFLFKIILWRIHF